MIASIEDGVGAALFNGGSLYRGFASSAGEWGHMCIVAGGRRCRCGGRGCLEAYVGAHALIERWAESDSRLRDVVPDDAETWIQRLVTTEATTPTATKLLEETATYLGIAAANVVNLLNPERIVICGWAGLLLGPVVLERMRQVISEQALTYPAHRVSLELGQLGNDAGELAAATLVIAEFLTAGGRSGEPPATPGIRLASVDPSGAAGQSHPHAARPGITAPAPLERRLSATAADIVTIPRAYHLYALPANRLRVATDWFSDLVEHRQFVRLGLVRPENSRLAVAEDTDIYYRTDGRPLERDRRA